MYSGTTLTTLSGRVLGGHQKIDRVARRHLSLLQTGVKFPTIRSILHFEGDNGPDAIKRKSPAQNEPWHYYQPFNDSDTLLPATIADHYKNLVHALKTDNDMRAAFEAAWLAHAIVDGLTPAHHYPYEEKLVELRGGKGIESRTTLKEKMLFPGDTLRHQAHNNWKYWGPKGLFTTHYMFEWGVATVMAPLSLKNAFPTQEEIETFREIGIVESFKRTAKEIAALDMYGKFYKKGWTPKLSRQVRKQLAPTIVRAVTLAWYGAVQDTQEPVKSA